jgi:hypothetical protein
VGAVAVELPVPDRGAAERLQQRWSKLDLGGACAAQSSREAFTGLLRRLRRKAWVVYAKRPFAGPSGVFRYLGQYTHRVAISSHRLVSVTASRVVFRTRGSQRVGVTPEEFIRRFLLHVLPAGYHKIRHYGLYASSHVPTRLEEARAALWRSGHAVKSEPAPDAERVASDASARGDCPVCGTALVRAPLDYAELLLDATAHGLPAGVDTS